MDKQTTLGFILIGVVLIVWMWLQAPPPGQQRLDVVDSLTASKTAAREIFRSEEALPPRESIPLPEVRDSTGTYFSHLISGEEKVLIVKTDLYTAEVTTKGGLIRKWELQKYNTWDDYKVDLVDLTRGGSFSLLFQSSDGKLINTSNLLFESDFENWKTVELKDDEIFSVDLVLQISDDQRIVKHLTFTNGKYSFDAEIEFRYVETVISNFEYQVTWENGIRYAEHNSVDESNVAMAYAYSGGELVELDATDTGESVTRDISGATDWVAVRNKYFAVAIMPDAGTSEGAYMEGLRLSLPDGGAKENYSVSLKMPFVGSALESARFTVFLGPLDLNVLKAYERDLDQIMSLGWAWIIRPISAYLLIPLFNLLGSFIPNFGFVIIVFSIIIKIALHPLSKTSMKSMKKMQALQPYMNEIRAKYKDDPQKMNKQVMNLYKEYGVNPAAGCLPLLLQMPILFALFTVFRSAIELRQAGFIWWIKDLSIPDTLFTLPFTLPFFGISHVSGLALAMGITMFMQQKMTVTDPRQKAMVWMMPIMLTLLFNSFPSGLNLYYFMFNLLSIGQQAWVNKHHGSEPLRKVDQKKKSTGLLAQLSKHVPKTR